VSVITSETRVANKQQLKYGTHFTPLPSLALPSHPLRFPSIPFPSLSPSPPFRSRPLKSSWGSAVSSPSWVWGRTPAEIELGAF